MDAVQRRYVRFWVIAVAALCVQAGAASNAADLRRGALLFQTCSACHSVLGDGVGPDITGIYGQKAASRTGFNYSAAMRSSNLVWDEDTLRRFLRDPQHKVPGTLMTFPGYASSSDIDDVIAYLKSQGTP